MFGNSNSLGQPSARPFGRLLVFGMGNNADNNPFAAKPFDEPSALASQSPEFMFGRGSGPKFGDTKVTKPGQSTIGAGSIPSPAFETSSFPSFRSPIAPLPAFGLITNSKASDGAGTMSGSPAFPETTASSSLGQSTPFPSVSQKGVQPGFGVPGIGTRVIPYKVTNVLHDPEQFGKMHSISAMPAYANKSHEELRWEDHQSKNKGAAMCDFNPFRMDNTGRNPFSLSSTSSWSKPTYNPFSSLSTTSAATTVSISPWSKPTYNPFSSLSTTSAAATVSPSPSTTTRPNPFSTASSPITFPLIVPRRPSSPAVTSTTTANLSPSSTTASISPFTLSLPNTFPVSNAPFSFSSLAKPSSSMSIPTPQQTTFLSFPSPAPAQTNNQSSVSSLLFPANPVGLNQSSFSIAPVQLSAPQTTSSFDVINPGQSQLMTTGTTGLHNIPMAQLEPVTNPFGTLPPAPQLSFDRTGTRHPTQYGISTLPVVERPARARRSSLLITTSRDLSYWQLKLPVRKYNPRNNVPKVSFFGEDVEGIAVPRADAFFIRRENPRDLIIRPLPEIRMSHSDDKQSRMLNEASYAAGETEDGPLEEDQYRSSDPSVIFTQPAEIDVLMPKLCGSDYYTEPAIQELASKEKVYPGFCSHVEGFVIGRHDYGNMRFLGDTDVRGLDLSIIVQFNHREVIVYAEGSSKPKVGEGLNKPAEVTLLNIKCMDKKTGQRYTEGQKVKKYREFLKKKADDQGGRFVSYDPVKGEWKFIVDHF